MDKVATVKSGIDTIELATSSIETGKEKKIYVNELKKHEIVSIDKIKSCTKTGKIKFPVKPSRISDNDLSTKAEVEEAIVSLVSEIGDILWTNRIDVTIDFVDRNIEEMKKMIAVFLETLSLVRGGEMMFKTVKDIVRTGNMKIRKDRRATTVYNCEDKDRETDVRLEQKFFDLGRTEEEFFVKLKKVILAILEELEDVESNLEEMETLYIEKLSKIYDEDIEDDTISTFTDFVMKYNSVILTKGILKGLYKHSKLKGNFNEWLKKYRKAKTKSGRPRKIKLIKRSDLTKFIKVLRKEYKSILKR